MAAQSIDFSRSAESPVDAARAQLLVEAMDDVHQRAGRYVLEPSEVAWHSLVDALARAHGDGEAYDLLRAIEIHTRISNR